MENFSTPHQALVPRIANLATLAVVVAATWWSGAQRPADSSAEAVLQTPVLIPVQATQQSTQAAPALLPAVPPANLATPATAQTLWTTQNQALRHDGLQAVGYSAAARR